MSSAFSSVHAYKRQVNAQFLLEYTKRVDELIQAFPRSVWSGEVGGGDELPPESEE